MMVAAAVAKPVVAGALVPAEIVFVVAAAAAFLPLVATYESERLVFFSFFTPSCVVPHRCRSLLTGLM